MLQIKKSELKQLAQNKFGNDSVESQNKILVMISTSLAARTSYTVVGKKDKQHSYEADLELHDRLAESGHWSPFEHCARVMDDMERAYYYTSTGPTPDKFHTGVLGNFRGFIQYRKMFENENIL